ncbi:pentapeptide repeat-containing protein [Nocardioides jensenii]|uniref:pentapeptide repeat-containing protein n=1 Tax=Nocardioides jensenii TaxID=1843 RepID=UPI0009E98395|nr:pentapeptide repeat-containing protein [Nocardioides jensenii]
MLDLVADCRNCAGLCCVALPFTRSADFAFSKDGGEPCPNLAPDFGCGVHDRLRPLGMIGCTTYDCFGAGQAVTQGLYDGRDWRSDPARASEMFEVFGSVRRLHEMLFYLTDARDELIRTAAEDNLLERISSLVATTESLTLTTPYDVLGVDVDAHRLEVGPLLREASVALRAHLEQGVDVDRVRRDDLAGQGLSDLDLRAADLRGKLLIGADLHDADLRGADLLGADLRGCDVRGADLRNALFLTQMQVNAATGDGATRINPTLTRPSHWA